MSVEKFSDDEKKRKKLSEKQKKSEIAKKLEHSKEKKVISSKIEKDQNLAKLKSVVERGFITPDILNHIIEGENLELSEVNEILDCIDEIESTYDIDHILPKIMRISKEEYLIALNEKDKRKIVIGKTNAILDHLYLVSNPSAGAIFDMFSGMFFALNKNLLTAQENTIDIKNSLLDKDRKDGLGNINKNFLYNVTK